MSRVPSWAPPGVPKCPHPAGAEQQQPAVPQVGDAGGRRPVRLQGHRPPDRRGREGGHPLCQRSATQKTQKPKKNQKNPTQKPQKSTQNPKKSHSKNPKIHPKTTKIPPKTHKNPAQNHKNPPKTHKDSTQKPPGDRWGQGGFRWITKNLVGFGCFHLSGVEGGEREVTLLVNGQPPQKTPKIHPKPTKIPPKNLPGIAGKGVDSDGSPKNSVVFGREVRGRSCPLSVIRDTKNTPKNPKMPPQNLLGIPGSGVDPFLQPQIPFLGP